MRYRENVYAACRGYVVVFVVGKVWRIVPCVYKIYTLDRFQFHGLLKNNPIRFSGGEGGSTTREIKGQAGEWP